MNQIRLNNEKEKIIATGEFRIPPKYIIYNVLWILGGVITLFAIIGIFLIIYGVIRFILNTVQKNKLSCVVTNQRIYGTTANGFLSLGSTSYSYRLDRIDSIEIHQYLGLDSLIIRFSNGNMNQNGFNSVTRNQNLHVSSNYHNRFSINYLDNADYLFRVLNSELLKIKNDTNLKVDIEMKRLEIESKKIEAISNLGKNLTSNVQNKEDKVEKLRELKNLLDNGAIDINEYNFLKNEILNK